MSGSLTWAVAVLLLGALLLYCGIKGRSLRHAVFGAAVPGAQGSLLG